MPLLEAAWSRGVNTIDTANVYSNGESERIIGKFMKKVHLLLFWCIYVPDHRIFAE